MNGRIRPFAGQRIEAALPHGASLAKGLHVFLFVLFILCAGAWAAVYLGALPGRYSDAIALGVVLSATATTIAGSTQRLPLQNVLLAAVVIAFIGGAVQILGAATGIPFGAIYYRESAGHRLFNLLPWPMPLVWVVLILNARGVARLILRPWRKTRTYGFRVIGLACALAALFDLGLEPFACRVNRCWIWQTKEGTPAWYGAPWVNFIGWFLTALLILVFATPALINKNPVRRPPHYHPLVVWLALNFIFAAAAAAHQLWWAAGLVVIANGVVAVFAFRGARW